MARANQPQLYAVIYLFINVKLFQYDVAMHLIGTAKPAQIGKQVFAKALRARQ